MQVIQHLDYYEPLDADLAQFLDHYELDDLSATLPSNDDEGEPAPEESAQDRPWLHVLLTGQEMVPHVPTVCPPTPAGLGQPPVEVSAYRLGNSSGGETQGWHPSLARCDTVQRQVLLERYESVRPNLWATWKLSANEERKEYRCVCDEGRGIHCFWHRCQSSYGEEMRGIHYNGQGLTIWEDHSRAESDKSRLCDAAQEEAGRVRKLDTPKKRKGQEEGMEEVPDRRYSGLKHSKRDANSLLAQFKH